MTTWDINGEKYEVNFCYPDTEHHRYTQCQIFRIEGPEEDNATLLGMGLVSCYISDPYSKIMGRKMALTNALENAGFDKDIRTKFWMWYKQTCRYIC